MRVACFGQRIAVTKRKSRLHNKPNDRGRGHFGGQARLLRRNARNPVTKVRARDNREVVAVDADELAPHGPRIFHGGDDKVGRE
ncbi:hypothetical protein D3C71_1195250 [compost metagenome]